MSSWFRWAESYTSFTDRQWTKADISSVIFVNENENGEKRENNEFVNEN